MLRGKAIAAGVLLFVSAGFAVAQGRGTARNETADDVINRVLQEEHGVPASPTPASTNPAPTGAAATSSPPSRTSTPVKLPIVLGARIGEHDDRTRFVVEFSDPVAIRTFGLSNPNRVVIDMPAVAWHLDGPQRPTGFGAVKSYRYGLFRPGNSRFVIDLNQPVTVSDPLVLPPEGGYGYRVVIDLFPTSQAKFNGTSGWPSDLKAREFQAERLAALIAPSLAAAPRLNAKKTVVIDAGHGGLDSGTTSHEGLMEKDLVLDEAIRLAHAIERRGGFVVHLTRDSDAFIPLRERVNIARSWRADLFISLHADSNPDPGVSGASVYTLSLAGSDKEAAALARKENQSDVIAGVDLTGENSEVAPILIDLAQRDTINRSSRFAQTLLGGLSRSTDVLTREPHRSAAFAVLKAPDVPAVLIELGYLSNDGDADQMKSASWRNGVAEAIASAVDRNFAQSQALAPEPVPE